MTRDEWIEDTVEDRIGAYATHLSAARAREYAKEIARDAMAFADRHRAGGEDFDTWWKANDVGGCSKLVACELAFLAGRVSTTDPAPAEGEKESP